MKAVYCPDCEHRHDTFEGGFSCDWVCTRKAEWRRHYQTGEWKWIGVRTFWPNRKGKCRHYQAKEGE